ncbi:MAG: PaaX family transcriptional regulator C-terminal domain-containing protein [Acidobacteriota bacterium]
MAQSIKKQDSVSSIIMFIFNVFLVERGINSIPLKKILHLVQPFNKNETAVRMGLSRAVQNGILRNVRKDNEVHYELTESGVEAVEEWRRVLAEFRHNIDAQVAGWSGFWNTVFISDSTFNNSDTLALVLDILAEHKYGMLSKNLWICPYGRSSAFAKVLNMKKTESLGVQIFESRPLQNNRVLANMVWGTEKLAARYSEFFTELNKEVQALKQEKTAEGILPFLHRFGIQLFEIIKDDPQLPMEVLPEGWLGLEAARTFNGIREDLLPAASEYIDQVLAE